MNEVIELLESDDEQVENAARAPMSEDEDDEIEFIGVSNASTNKKAPNNTALRNQSVQQSSENRASTITTPRNPYSSSAPRLSLEPTTNTTSTSDTRTRNLSSGKVQRPKNPYTTPKNTPRSVSQFKSASHGRLKNTRRAVSQSSQSAYDSDDSSDDDLIMNGGPTFSRKRSNTNTVPTQSTSTGSSVRKSADTTRDAARASFPESPRATSLSSSPPMHVPLMAATRTPNPVNNVPFQYPALLHNSKKYKDLRPNYILALWKFVRSCTQHSYNSRTLDQVANKIFLLALTPHPVRSLEEYCFGRGHGGAADVADHARRDMIKEQLEQGGLNTICITPIPANQEKRYYSIVEACLVAMMNETERRLGGKDIDPRVLNVMDDDSIKNMLGEKNMWVSLEDLIPAIDALLKPECPARMTRAGDEDNGAAHYTNAATKSAEFLQMRKLENIHKDLGDYDTGRIKRHMQRGKVLYELTHLGYKSAKMVKERQFPLPPNFYRTSRIQLESQVGAPFKNICIGVDLREGGGGHRALHEMCNTLDVKKVPFFVASLKIGDYVFFTRGPTGSLDYLCPILVERKSIEDIALSISDGRWKSQKQRMYHGQYIFGYGNSRMVFIIEGKEEKQQVTGGYIGHRMHNVDMQRLRDEIENLKSEGFHVLRTPSRKQTMFELARWSEKIAKEMHSGVLTAEYTYAEFNEKAKEIPHGTDFSRLAKYEMQKREHESSPPAASAKRPYQDADLDSDSDIEILEISSPPRTKNKKPAAQPTLQRKSPLIDRKKKAAERTFSRGDIADKPTTCVSAGESSEKKKEHRPSSSKKAKTSTDYSDWTKTQLEEECVKFGLPKTGKKTVLIERLQSPHLRPPEIVQRRTRSGEYAPPRHDVGNTAVLVALYLHEKDAGDDNRGLSREELFAKAESLCITKNPFCGGTTQTGPYHYDGMSGMKKLLNGDPPLVKKKNREGYKLTRCSETAGYPLAEALHRWCHAWGNCSCGATNV
jgi:ERCC4-type nuclease